MPFSSCPNLQEPPFCATGGYGPGATPPPPARAQTAVAAPAANSAATAVAQPTNPFTVYGFVDAYYGSDFKHAATNERPHFIFSHNRQNEFTVNQGLIGLRCNTD